MIRSRSSSDGWGSSDGGMTRPCKRIAHADPRPAVLDRRSLILISIKRDAGLGVFFHVAIGAVLS